MGVPSTLASGLRPPSLTTLQGLADAQTAHASELVFVSGSLRQMSERMPRHIRFTTQQLSTARERMAFEFGMRGWQLDVDSLAHWRYLLRFRDRSALGAWLTEGEERFVDFEDLISPDPKAVARPPNYEQALMDRLEGPQVDHDGSLSRQSQRNYDATLHAVILQPLIARAELIADPGTRATQIELAEHYGLLAQFRQNLAVALSHGQVPVKEVKSYLALAAHVARGMRDSGHF